MVGWNNRSTRRRFVVFFGILSLSIDRSFFLSLSYTILFWYAIVFLFRNMTGVVGLTPPPFSFCENSAGKEEFHIVANSKLKPSSSLMMGHQSGKPSILVICPLC